jgi:hypothetical protein
MGATLVSSNTTIKISAAISNQVTNSGTLYTCPANSYAIVNLAYDWTAASCFFQVAGRTVGFITGADATVGPIYVGPGQAVTITAGASGTGYISGVEFINTP